MIPDTCLGAVPSTLGERVSSQCTVERRKEQLQRLSKSFAWVKTVSVGTSLVTDITQVNCGDPRFVHPCRAAAKIEDGCRKSVMRRRDRDDSETDLYFEWDTNKKMWRTTQ